MQERFGISRGMIGFDRETKDIYAHGGSEILPKKSQNLDANKTGRGILSPIQMKDLGFVYATA